MNHETELAISSAEVTSSCASSEPCLCRESVDCGRVLMVEVDRMLI